MLSAADKAAAVSANDHKLNLLLTVIYGSIRADDRSQPHPLTFCGEHGIYIHGHVETCGQWKLL